jgi:hypothetical protein
MSAHLEPDSPTLAKRLGAALLAVVIFPIAGIPFLIGIAAESAVIAGITGWSFDTVMIVQLVPVAVLATCGLVYVAVSTFLHPDDEP